MFGRLRDDRVNRATVTGTFANAVGGTDRIRDGKWDGKVLQFWVPWDSGRLEATGVLVGATLELDMKTSQWHIKHVFKRPPAVRR